MIPESATKEAIGLLIELAERGEIDPWDVNVIDVVDRFLAKLVSDERQGLYDSGQALLYASMLVLLKANSLSQKTTVEEETDLEAPIPIEGNDVVNLPLDLENHLHRRTAVSPPSRRITLQELITQLESLAAEIGKEPRKRPRQHTSRQSQKAAMKAIAQLAHKENLSEIALALEHFFLQHPIDRDILELAQIFNDKVGVFWALLLLSAQSKVVLSQEEFYGNIQVMPTIGVDQQACV